MSCPYTSQQNGKAECSLRTLTNIMRCLLFRQVSLRHIGSRAFTLQCIL
jgi:hypothetical protein